MKILVIKSRDKMNIAIIAATGAVNYRLLNEKLNELIESSGCYLFNILCGSIENNKSKEETLGETWARKNGAPVIHIYAKTVNELVDKLILKADYAIFILDGNPLINNIFMRYKMSEKHGSVIMRKG